MTNISLASIASQCAQALLEEKAHTDKAKASREVANKAAMQLHKAKAIIGRYNACATATAFVDTLVAGGLAKKTAQNYLSLLKEAVKTGKPIADLGGSKAGGRKGKSKSKGNKAFADLFRPAFNHDEGKTFETLCSEIQAKYENAEFDNLYEGFVDYLKSEGDEIAE